MKKNLLRLMVLFVGLLVVTGLCLASGGEKKAPPAVYGSMMFEHADMACTICHGENGPKGVDMGNHPSQKCTDCHIPGTAKIKRIEKKTSIAREMMLKHGAALNCKTCHGNGPKGVMMLEHMDMDCHICHVVEER